VRTSSTSTANLTFAVGLAAAGFVLTPTGECQKHDKDNGGKKSKSHLKTWTVVTIPKRGTALEVDLPWFVVPNSNDGGGVASSEPRMERITI
jgi:hypothetical protein